MSLYASPSVKESMWAISEAFLNRINSHKSEHVIETRFGKGFCLELGNRNKPPLVIVHGGFTNHAFASYYLRDLLDHFHVYAVDLPGHPGRSSEQVPDPRTDDYGEWMVEMLDGLHLEKAHLMGLSYGGFVCQRATALAPNRVLSLVLMVSGGLCDMSVWSSVRHLLGPQIMLKLTKSDTYLDAMMNAIFTDLEETTVRDFFRHLILDYKADSRRMKLSKRNEFESWNGRALVLTAEKDVIFDHRCQEKAAKKIFKNIKSHCLLGAKHSPSMKDHSRAEISQVIREFLNEKSGSQ